MLPTSIAVMAMCGLLSPSNSQPAWQTDYRVASTLAAELQKPLAVFITKGDGVVTTELPAEVKRRLVSDYVALVINSDTPTGKLLSERFELSQGVVISDRTGAKQALRIEGTINPTGFADTLAQLADPSRTTIRTEVRSVEATVFAPVPTTPVVQASASVAPFTPSPSFSQPVTQAVYSPPAPAVYAPPAPAVYTPPAPAVYTPAPVSHSVVPSYFAPAATAVCRTGT